VAHSQYTAAMFLPALAELRGRGDPHRWGWTSRAADPGKEWRWGAPGPEVGPTPRKQEPRQVPVRGVAWVVKKGRWRQIQVPRVRFKGEGPRMRLRWWGPWSLSPLGSLVKGAACSV